ncbi:MAG: sigma-54 interaction domain-containing protein [Desulfurivibrionaceae bacterium]
MQELFSLIEKVCNTDTTVLIQGESGTGKELIAQALHYNSDREQDRFIPVNCGAIPAELLESELFGHEKGAFTNAYRARPGRFEMANGGTVFLDEIGDMSPMLQVKLLRVLQEKKFERIGGTSTINSDFRVIAATNQNLEEEVRQGKFREDLYYRLTVIPLNVPPLRDRRDDIRLLIDYFIERYNQSKGREIRGVDDQVLYYLLRYSWPGNVRELENLIERMVILASGDTIKIDDLPEQVKETKEKDKTLHPVQKGIEEIPEHGFVLQEAVAEYENKLIIQALQQTGWIKNRAAKLLNVNRTTLLEKMKRAGIGVKN